MNKINDTHEFQRYCSWCVLKEPKLKTVIDRFGYPPFWHREPDFATLVLTILEQQVSLASAKAAYLKLEERIENVTPENVLKLAPAELRDCYFSRQKIIYVHRLANEIVSGKLDLAVLNTLNEHEIRARLIKLKGIGNWTIDMYLLMSLHFADIFPPGDLATIKAVFELNLVHAQTSKNEIIEYMKLFSPWQSVATYILWHAYIEKRNLKLEYYKKIIINFGTTTFHMRSMQY